MLLCVCCLRVASLIPFVGTSASVYHLSGLQSFVTDDTKNCTSRPPECLGNHLTKVYHQENGDWTDGVYLAGEVSDSESDENKASDANFDSAPEEFDDGLDENLIRDDEDRKRLEQMTEKEREQELFNRIEKREVMRTR